MDTSDPSPSKPNEGCRDRSFRAFGLASQTKKLFLDSQIFNRSDRTAAALSGPILCLLITSFLLNAGSGIALWLKPSQTWRTLHGWSNPFFLITFGVILRVHALRGWRLRKNLLSGFFTILSFLILVLSGWAIYYPVNPQSDEAQKYASTVHTWMGLCITFILLFHAVRGWQTRRQDT